MGGAKKFLSNIWEYEQGGEKRFENDEYIFRDKDNRLTIEAKDGRGVVVDNNGLTKAATKEEFNLLQTMDWEVSQYEAIEEVEQQKERELEVF